MVPCKSNSSKFLAILLILLVSISYGAEKLKLELKGFIVKKKENKEILLPVPKSVNPGDVIEYRIKAKNTTQEVLRNVEIKALIPKGTEYIPKSATPKPEPLFSIDGGKTYSHEPVKYKTIENGKEVEKVATPDMYTNIKWILPSLSPSEEVELRYRVKVK